MQELARALELTDDPVKFARAWLSVEPHPGQQRWLLAEPRPTAVLVTGRRWGKSTVAAIQLLYNALKQPGSQQCIVSITLDQALIVFSQVEEFIRRNPALELFVEQWKQSPFPYLKFKNGSAIMVRTGAREGMYLRGHKFHRVVVDEADYLSESLITEAVRMTLADVGGQLVMTTTPRALRGYVYRMLQLGLQGDPNVYAQVGTTFENPHVDHEYIRSIYDQMPTSAWVREIEGQYVEDTGSVFRWQDIQAAYEDCGWLLPEEPRQDRLYVQGVDPAKQNDHTVHVILDVTERPFRVVLFERYQRRPWPAIGERVRELHQRYHCRLTLFDATGVGGAVLDEIGDVARPFVFTGKSKVELISRLQVALERREIRFPFIRELVDELQAYTYQDSRLSTDAVMALALAVRAATQTVQSGPIIRAVALSRSRSRVVVEPLR